MQYISLTNSDKKLIVDDDMYEEFNKLKWFLRKNGYVQCTSITNMTAHRFIMGIKEGYEIDHLNRNRLDCRKENLEFKTHFHNCQNKGTWSKSGEKYIYYEKRTKSFKVQIHKIRKNTILGRFKTIEEAVIFRDKQLLAL